jgi:hypothetical protein
MQARERVACRSGQSWARRTGWRHRIGEKQRVALRPRCARIGDDRTKRRYRGSRQDCDGSGISRDPSFTTALSRDSAGKVPTQLRDSLLADAAPTEILPRIEIATRTELGGSYWLLRGGVAKQVKRTLAGSESYRSTHDLRQAAQEALAAITDSQLVPVLLADDTDRLMRVADDPEQAERLFRGFFGEVLREIAEQLECGLVLAIHNDYLRHEQYEGFTTGRIVTKYIPPLTESCQLAQIISRRGEFLATPARCEDLLTSEGLERLTLIHNEGRDGGLRATLSIFHQALTLAAKDGSGRVDERHIHDAASASP